MKSLALVTSGLRKRGELYAQSRCIASYTVDTNTNASDCHASNFHWTSLLEASWRPEGLISKSQCSLVINYRLSFTHVAPVLQNFTLNYGGKRLDLGKKALTNYLKELVSYRSVNLMDEYFLMDDVKENLCFVLLDVARNLQFSSCGEIGGE
ncbi:hypothetical protein LguiB_009845 [Lonicera macranthoides]